MVVRSVSRKAEKKEAKQKASTRQLIGAMAITDYSLVTYKEGELVYFIVKPSNLSLIHILIAQPYQQIVGTLCMDDGKGINNQYVDQDKCVVENRNLIRRLTPLECERLQGFPDGWTDIPSASDSARYKALGNSVAIPCVDFVLRGIAYFLRRIREECPDFL